MAWFPISHTVAQYVDTNGDPYSGAVLKAYESGTTSNISMATASSGTPTVSSIALNSAGFPEVSGSVVIPYVNETYKLALYPDQASADADSGAIWTPDAIPISSDLGSSTIDVTADITLDSTNAGNNIRASGTFTITMPGIASGDLVGAGFICSVTNVGTGVVTLDGAGAELIEDSATKVLRPGESTFCISSDSLWSLIGNDKPMQVVTLTSTGNATTINLQLGDVFEHTFTENTTFTFSNPSSTGVFSGFVLYLTNDGTGRTPTWPASVDWDAGNEPILSAANEVNVLTFTTIDGGTTWIGTLAIRAAS